MFSMWSIEHYIFEILREITERPISRHVTRYSVLLDDRQTAELESTSEILNKI